MEYKLVLKATIEADSEEEAQKIFIEEIKQGFYSYLDVEIEDTIETH